MPITNEQAMEIAAFRFSIIADFVNGRMLLYGEKEKLLHEKAEQSYKIPGSTKTRISVATIRKWIKAYEDSGSRIESLIPKTRSDRGRYRKLDARLRIAIKDLKDENPNYTVPAMVQIMRQQGLIKTDDKLNLATIYRFIRDQGLKEPARPADDRRRFEAEYPNSVWQCDAMHGPSVRITGKGFQKSYLMAIIDDHSRLIVHAEFYLNETFSTLKDCLKKAVVKRGLPHKFYVDNGACYKSTNLDFILASLGIALVHSRPYMPEGRGKIERWFRNVRQSFLPIYAPKPVELEELNVTLERWIDEYNDSIHSITKMTPYERFRKHMSCIRPAPDRLIDYFRHVETRRVRKDRTIQLQGKVYEVPTGLIDKSVELRFHPEDMDEIEVYFDSRSFGKARVVDTVINARIGRDNYLARGQRDHEPALEEQTTPTGELF